MKALKLVIPFLFALGLCKVFLRVLVPGRNKELLKQKLHCSVIFFVQKLGLSYDYKGDKSSSSARTEMVVFQLISKIHKLSVLIHLKIV